MQIMGLEAVLRDHVFCSYDRAILRVLINFGAFFLTSKSRICQNPTLTLYHWFSLRLRKR